MSTFTPPRPDAIFGFAECMPQARGLAAALGVACHEVAVRRFPDGESLVRVPAVSERPVLYRSLNDPNTKLIELLLAASVLRPAAAHLTLVAPYLAYMRQDKAFNPGEAVSQTVIGRALAPAFDSFLTVDPHLHRTPSLDAVFMGKPALALSAAPCIGAYLRAEGATADLLVFGPDEESEPIVAAVAAAAGCGFAVARKQRRGDRDVTITLPPQVTVVGRPVAIVDDVISSGATICTLAGLLRDAGASAIDVCATHALFHEPAANTMLAAGARRVVSCDTVIHPSNAIPLARHIAGALGPVFI